MKTLKISYLFPILLAAACNAPEDYYMLPKPAALEYGEITTSSTSSLSTQSLSKQDSTSASNDDWKSMIRLEVGRKPFGSSSMSSVRVKNTGDLPASIEKLWLSEQNSSMFKVTSECGDTIPGNSHCLLHIIYSPDTIGETPSVLNISYDDGEGKKGRSTLPIMATASNLAFLQFEQEKVEFQNTTIGYSLSATFKVLYNGSKIKTSDIKIQPAKGVTISNLTDASFVVDKDGTTCGDVIENDCVIKVNFLPKTEGKISSSLSVNYFNGAEVLKINGASQGSGLKAEVLATLSAALADFGKVVASPVAPKILSIPVVFAGSVPAEKVTVKAPTSSVYEIIGDVSKSTCLSSVLSGNCVLQVAFDPSQIGTFSDSIVISYTSQGQPRDSLKINLSGQAVSPALISSDVSAISYGDIPAFKKITKSFTLKNNGQVAVSNLSAVTVVGGSYTAAFEAKCATLAPADTCKLNISNQIKTASAANATFSFNYFDGRENQNVKLEASGKGTSPLVIEASTTIDFGNVMIGHPVLPAAQIVYPAIYGTTALTNASQLVLPAPLTSPFASTLGGTSSCKAPLDPNKSNSCRFDISLITNAGTPDVVISQPFKISYEGDGKNGAGTLNFTVKVTPRKAPELLYADGSSFKTVSVNDYSDAVYTIKNNSAYFATSFKAIEVVGDQVFKVIENGCSGGVAKSASCTVKVRFQPTDAKNYSAKLRYTYNNQISNQVIEAPMSAIGSKEVTILADVAELNFGTVYIGDAVAAKNINLKYYGASDWEHTKSAVEPFKVDSSDCGDQGDCKVLVDFTPTAAGDFQKTLELTYTPALNKPGIVRVVLKGKAQARVPALAITPSSFPKTLVGQNTNLVVTLKNNGTMAAQNINFGAIPAPYRFTADGAPGTSGNCPVNVTLEPGKSCTLKLNFEPTAVGKAEISIDINHGSGSVVKSVITSYGTQMIKAYAGAYQTCMINELGNVSCWGRNSSGQLGLGHNQSVSQKVSAMTNLNFGTNAKVQKIAIGDSHACAIVDTATAKGQVSCWGNNSNGKLGLGNTTNTNSPMGAGQKLNVVNLGSDADLDSAVDIVAGFEHTCVTQKSGEIKCWGGNTSDQLGNESGTNVGSSVAQMGDSLKPISFGGRNLASISKVQSVSSGSGHTCSVMESGDALCWGDNFYGQLGQGSELEKIAIHDDASALAPISFGKNFVAKTVLASSGAFTCALSTTGDVKCFGKTVANEKTSKPFYGVLGSCLSRRLQNSAATDCSTNSYLPTSSLGYLSSDMGDNLKKVDFGNLKALQITLGSAFGCALLNDKSVKCWGLNDNGQLGIGSTAAIGSSSQDMGANLQSALKFEDGEPVQVVSGYEHACAVLKNNTLKCWGSSFENVTGLYGSGLTTDTGRTPTSVPSKLPVVYDGR